MCGITGFASIKALPSDVILEMNAAISHRGPDDEGYIFGEPNQYNAFSGNDSPEKVKENLPQLSGQINGTFGMGFRRLALVDLSVKGHQPMISDIGNVIIFNGEIYNFREIKEELIAINTVFFSQTDTEVIIKGYEVWGEDIVKKLDGMFCFCILDKQKQRLFFARDRFGQKPLFYFKNENGFFWASEIKALLKSGQITPEINWDGVANNFMYQTCISPQTCFRGIISLQPGHSLSYDLITKSVSEKSYWEIPNPKNSKITIQEAALNIERLLKKSIRKQLKADAGIISMMSGGIDSTLITGIAKEGQPTLEAFTVEFSAKDNETNLTNEAAEKFQVKFSVKEVSKEEIFRNLKENIAHFEEPYTSVEVLLHAAEFAKHKGYKILLSGNGADEIFGGYSHLLKLKRWKFSRKFRLMRHIVPGKTPAGKKIRRYLEMDTLGDFYQCGQGGMTHSEVLKLFIMPVPQKLKNNTKSSYQNYFREDFQKSLASHHAFRDDLSAMRFGTEFRYPYLQNDLVDYVAQLPEDIRYNGKINKPLLREIAKKHLPETILSARKRGFSFPIRDWYLENPEFREFIHAHLAQLKKRKIFSNELISLWEINPKTPSDFYKLWQLVTFEIWHQTYLD